MYRMLGIGAKGKTSERYPKTMVTLDNPKDPQSEVDEAKKGQTKGDENMKVITIWNPILPDFSNDKGRLVANERTITNNMFKKENLREIYKKRERMTSQMKEINIEIQKRRRI